MDCHDCSTIGQDADRESSPRASGGERATALDELFQNRRGNENNSIVLVEDAFGLNAYLNKSLPQC